MSSLGDADGRWTGREREEATSVGWATCCWGIMRGLWFFFGGSGGCTWEKEIERDTGRERNREGKKEKEMLG